MTHPEGAGPRAKKVRAYYPFLFALFPALFLFAYNIEESSLAVIFAPMAASLALVALVWSIARLALRDGQKAGLLAFVFSFMFFSYGRVLVAVFPRLARRTVPLPTWSLWAWAILFAGLACLVVRSRRRLAGATALLNIFVLVLLLMPVLRIVTREFTAGRFVPRWSDEAEDRRLLERKPSPATVRPDIYYLIFDRYASGRNLQHFYGFDNSPFYSMLAGSGFHVVADSRCNHPGTYLSLCSSLNMELLPDLLGDKRARKSTVNRLLRDNRVVRLLKGMGYAYYHFGSWYEATKSNPNADVNFPPRRWTGLDNDFFLEFLDTTPLAALVRSRLAIFPHRNNVLRTFAELERVAGRPGPKFVFMHMLVPHSPFVFGPGGEPVSNESRATLPVERQYVNQVRFLNRRIEELVRAIDERSPVPPVIILQSDEGPAVEELPRRQLRELRERRRTIYTTRIRCGILNAFRFPGQEASRLPAFITPVNSFRLLFNTCFGARYGMRPDKTFHTRDSKTEVLGFREYGRQYFLGQEWGRKRRTVGAASRRARRNGSRPSASRRRKKGAAPAGGD